MKQKKAHAAYGSALLILCAGYLLCARGLFALHGMKQWPLILFACAVVVIALCALKKAPFAAILTSLAYSVSFAAGVIFQRDGVDPGGGRTNNLWLIWTALFLLITVAGVFAQLLHKRK